MRRWQNIPIVVLRPSIVAVGDSATGEVDRFDGPYILILLIVTSPPDLALPLPGRGDLPAPPSFPSTTSCVQHTRSVRDPRAVGRTFHLVDPAPLTARRVFELVAAQAGRRAPSAGLHSCQSGANGAEYARRSIDSRRARDAFLDALITPVSYNSEGRASEILLGTGIDCPPFEGYVDQPVVEFVAASPPAKNGRVKPVIEVDDPRVSRVEDGEDLPFPLVLDPGMVVRHVTVRVSDVVFLKGIVEACRGGSAQVFAERGGDLTLCRARGSRWASSGRDSSAIYAESSVRCAWMPMFPWRPRRALFQF